MIVLLVILSLFRLKMLKLHSMCFIVGVVIAAIINSIIIMIIDLWGKRDQYPSVRESITRRRTSVDQLTNGIIGPIKLNFEFHGGGYQIIFWIQIVSRNFL